MPKRRFISRVLLAAALAIGAGAVASAQAPASEAQIKAAFVYNFLKFVEWPVASFEHPGDSLVVAIVGSGQTADAALRFLAGKQVGDHPLFVRSAAWDESFTGVHAVFVTEGDAKKVRRVLAQTWAKPILSIGEGSDFATADGVIVLVLDQRRLRFDIDVDVADAAGLKVSSKLLALTRIVRSTKTNDPARR